MAALAMIEVAEVADVSVGRDSCNVGFSKMLGAQCDVASVVVAVL